MAPRMGENDTLRRHLGTPEFYQVTSNGLNIDLSMRFSGNNIFQPRSTPTYVVGGGQDTVAITARVYRLSTRELYAKTTVHFVSCMDGISIFYEDPDLELNFPTRLHQSAPPRMYLDNILLSLGSGGDLEEDVAAFFSSLIFHQLESGGLNPR